MKTNKRIPGGPLMLLASGALLTAFCLLQPPTVKAQWTTPDANQNINNTNSGNVGIGTTTPNALLEVKKSQSAVTNIIVDNPFTTAGNSAYSAFTLKQAGVNRLHIASVNDNHSLITPGTAQFWNFANAPTVFANNNTETMRISATGNLGIGTTNPLSQLHFGTLLNAGLKTYTSSATNHGFLFSSYMDTASPHRRYGDIVAMSNQDGFSGGSTIRFLTNPHNSFTALERMRIDYLGNVGIGIANPAYKLDVQGGPINSSVGLCIAGDCKTAWSQVGGSSQWTTSGSSIHYNSGNVGIGTASPNARLHVSAGDSSVALFGPNTTWSGSLAVGSGADLLSPISARAQVLSSNGNLHLDGGAGQSVYVGWLTPTNTIINGQGGNVGIGNSSPTEKLHVTGNGKFTGNLTVDGNINAKYQDVAEWVESSQELSMGTLVVLDHTKSNQVIASSQAYDTRVAGVISAQPGIALGEPGDNKVLVATTGRVKVKVDASRGPIQIGDLLVTSDIPGVAMKSEAVNLGGVQIHRPGTLIGKALEPLAKGQGKILVLLSLQ